MSGDFLVCREWSPCDSLPQLIIIWLEHNILFIYLLTLIIVHSQWSFAFSYDYFGVLWRVLWRVEAHNITINLKRWTYLLNQTKELVYVNYSNICYLFRCVSFIEIYTTDDDRKSLRKYVVTYRNSSFLSVLHWDNVDCNDHGVLTCKTRSLELLSNNGRVLCRSINIVFSCCRLARIRCNACVIAWLEIAIRWTD